jgi:D-psicose/D-tagatose/L-ribulose 3-epimerase
MRISISNIAWDVKEDQEVAALLNRYGIDAIDIAHSKYFPEPQLANSTDFARVRNWWKEHGVEITGMQALLFGTSGLNLFASTEVQAAMLNHLDNVCQVAAGIGAEKLVFGSPKNRDRLSYTDQQAEDIALDFFYRLGQIAKSHAVVICLEPNPVCYGCNFITGTDHAAGIVQKLAHPSIRLHLDTGSLTINGESPEQIVEQYADLIGHVHASEPNLATLGDGTTDHGRIAALLSAALPNQVVCIEMLASTNEPHLVSIERALQVASQHYRPESIALGALP